MKLISEMTDEELNEALAVEVMGWVKSIETKDNKVFMNCWAESLEDYLVGESLHRIMEQSLWRPTNDPNQAFEVLDKVYIDFTIDVQRSAGQWGVEIDGSNGYGRVKVGKWLWTNELPRAICEAVLQAVRKESEE